MPRRLVALPFALFTAATALDVLHLLIGLPAVVTWHVITAGLLLGIAVAAAEWLDRIFAEPQVRTSGSDLGVALVLVLFGVSWVLRLGQPEWEPTWAAVLAGWAGVAGLLGATAVRRLHRGPVAATG
ncbi:MAG: hexosaminidase [Pseudonocardiales bacterium]|jgi:ABC-type sulfate transport system permease component|nr:hexosaminidase [Pseudonocardiales bacterium]